MESSMSTCVIVGYICYIAISGGSNRMTAVKEGGQDLTIRERGDLNLGGGGAKMESWGDISTLSEAD